MYNIDYIELHDTYIKLITYIIEHWVSTQRCLLNLFYVFVGFGHFTGDILLTGWIVSHSRYSYVRTKVHVKWITNHSSYICVYVHIYDVFYYE